MLSAFAIRGRARRTIGLIAACLCVSTPGRAHAQTNFQLWGNLVFDWVRSDRLAYEIDVEPKVLIAAPEGTPAWFNLDVTPNVEFSPKGWYDLVADTTVGTTRQTDDVTTTEVTIPPYFSGAPDLVQPEEQFSGEMANALLSQYVFQLQDQLGVTINQAALQTAISAFQSRPGL